MSLLYKVYLQKFNHFIPYDYQSKMHGFIVKVLGDNNYGKNYNRYHYTNLIGCTNKTEGMVYSKECYFYVRLKKNDIELQEKLINNLIKHKNDMFYGLKIAGISMPIIESLEDRTHFRTVRVSPCLIARRHDKQRTFDSNLITQTEKYFLRCIRNKAKSCGFNLDENLSIEIRNVHENKTSVYRGLHNNGRVLEFIIRANAETKNFILVNGLGRSCGCGYGFLI